MNSKHLNLNRITIIVILLLVTSLRAIPIIVYENPYSPIRTSIAFTEDYLSELMWDYMGKENFIQIPDSLYSKSYLNFNYNPDGELESINTDIIFCDEVFFTESEMEHIFDYFKTLPPFELPNQFGKIYDHLQRKWISKDTINNNYYNHIIKDGYNIRCFLPSKEKENAMHGLVNVLQGSGDSEIYYIPDDINVDSLFGELNWTEVRNRYLKFDKEIYKKRFQRKNNTIYPPDYELNKDYYTWKKIPINNYNVNIQIPDSSRIKIAKDSLSATICMPDSSFLYLNYSRGITDTPLLNENTSPRSRIVSEITVFDKYLISKYDYDPGIYDYYWSRIRFRFGITATLYTRDKETLEEYEKYILYSIFIVLRPKYKTIYLD